MDEKRIKQDITQAVESRCAHLQDDPFLSQRILRQMQEKGTVQVKKKLSLGLILALILILISLSALATSLLIGVEMVEKTALPLALENDGKVRPEGVFSPEDIALLVQEAEKNGIQLRQDSNLMMAMKNGEGYYEEEAIMEICRAAFDGLYYEWTVEQRHWYGEIMVQIGFWSENRDPLPGENQMPAEEARTLALSTMQADPRCVDDLTDEVAFSFTEDFNEWGWTFQWLPRNLEVGNYVISFDHQGENISTDVTPRTWESYTEKDLYRAMKDTWGYRTSTQYSWGQEGWHAFREKLENAERSQSWNREYDAYLASHYPLPAEGDIAQQSAVEIALQDAAFQTISATNAILLEKDGQHIWKITVSSIDADATKKSMTYEMDVITGEILLKKDMTGATYAWYQFVLDEVYQAAVADMPTQEQVTQWAIEALNKELGTDAVPFRDETAYKITASFNSAMGRYSVRFTPLTLDHGTCAVQVKSDGTCKVTAANAGPLSCDNIMSRFNNLYGACNDWDQSTWVLMDKTMDALPAETLDGKLMKNTVYPEASSVKLSRDEALDIIALSCEGTFDFVRCMLIGDENPVWKAYGSDDTGLYLWEVDANTGEITLKMRYVTQNNKFGTAVQTYTLQGDYNARFIQEHGLEYLAKISIVTMYTEPFLDDPWLPIMDDEPEGYTITTEGRTVTFDCIDNTQPDYSITFLEDYAHYDITMTPGTEPMDQGGNG